MTRTSENLSAAGLDTGSPIDDDAPLSGEERALVEWLAEEAIRQWQSEQQTTEAA